MSVGYMSDGKLVTCATKDDLAAEASMRQAADTGLQESIDELKSSDDNLQYQIDTFQIILPIGEPADVVDGMVWIVE